MYRNKLRSSKRLNSRLQSRFNNLLLLTDRHLHNLRRRQQDLAWRLYLHQHLSLNLHLRLRYLYLRVRQSEKHWQQVLLAGLRQQQAELKQAAADNLLLQAQEVMHQDHHWHRHQAVAEVSFQGVVPEAARVMSVTRVAEAELRV